jgi:hypothetical protein
MIMSNFIQIQNTIINTTLIKSIKCFESSLSVEISFTEKTLKSSQLKFYYESYLQLDQAFKEILIDLNK